MKKLLRRHFDYSTRMHMKRRFYDVDYRFVGALIALGALVWAALRYLQF